ncbi:MAG: NAD(P)-dependent oxidoreductase [Desulfobacter sp.]|nr:NAD(P)-dependent oxidoreductase [Desulfobacter sp.]
MGKNLRIGFVGLGKMGAGICANIQKAGFALSVYNRTQSKTNPFVTAGAFGCKTPKEVASRSDIVLTSLMDDQFMLDAVTGESGILAGLKKGGIHICLTTISVNAAQELERLHRKKGCVYLSGPVVGRPDAAAAGKLKTFISGDLDAIEICKLLVEKYTSMVLPMGTRASKAISMKICANYMVISQMEMMGEVYTFAEKSGLHLDMLQMMFEMAFAESTLKMYAEKIKNRDFEDAGFDLAGGLKDLKIYEEAFTNVYTIPGIGKIVKDKMVTAMAMGMGKNDWSTTYEITRLEAGLKNEDNFGSPLCDTRSN